MATKTKTIQEQVAELEARCEKLENLQKIFDKAVRNEFEMDSKKIHKIIENNDAATVNFAKKIASYFDLKTSKDFDVFLSIFCAENSKNYYQKRKDALNKIVLNNIDC